MKWDDHEQQVRNDLEVVITYFKVLFKTSVRTATSLAEIQTTCVTNKLDELDGSLCQSALSETNEGYKNVKENTPQYKFTYQVRLVT
jgi:hypothetical protein